MGQVENFPKKHDDPNVQRLIAAAFVVWDRFQDRHFTRGMTEYEDQAFEALSEALDPFTPVVTSQDYVDKQEVELIRSQTSDLSTPPQGRNDDG